MIEYDLDTERSVPHVQPKSPLEQDDFVKLAKAVDPHIEATGGLAGLIIEAPSFPRMGESGGNGQPLSFRSGSSQAHKRRSQSSRTPTWEMSRSV
jgi:hypothetical protein